SLMEIDTSLSPFVRESDKEMLDRPGQFLSDENAFPGSTHRKSSQEGAGDCTRWLLRISKSLLSSAGESRQPQANKDYLRCNRPGALVILFHSPPAWRPRFRTVPR